MKNREQILKNLSKTIEGDAIQSLLKDKVKELGNISEIENWEDLLGRKKSIVHLENILSYLRSLKEVNVNIKKSEYL